MLGTTRSFGGHATCDDRNMLTKKVTLSVVISLCSLTAATPALATRNVLLIVVDDLGAQELRSYASDLAATANSANGSTGIVDTNANGLPDGLEDLNSDGQPDGAIATPGLDSLAAAGVRFTQVWSNPSCSPTRAGMYTGRYAIHHGIGMPLGGGSMIWQLPTDISTLAELVSNDSYAKGFFGKWHLGEETSALPTARGWNYFSGSTGGEVTSYNLWDKVVVDESGVRTDSVSSEYVTTGVVADTLDWIELQTKPWWATVALNAAHTPYTEPPSYCLSGSITGSGTSALFHKTIECADYHITSLLSGIDPTVLSNTTIVFVGDNGTEGSVSQVSSSAQSKASVYQGGVHVPLIVADGAAFVGMSGTGVGAVTSVGRTVSNITNTVDIFSSLAEIMGVTATGTDSVSFIDYLDSATAPALRTYNYSDTFSYSSSAVTALETSLTDPSTLTSTNVATLTRTGLKGAIRGTQYKLVYGNNTYKLFDLNADPFEQVNRWCTSNVYRTQGQTLITALRAIDTSYPTKSCAR